MIGSSVNVQYDVVHHLQQLVMHPIQRIARNIILVMDLSDVMACLVVRLVLFKKLISTNSSLGVLMQCLAGLWWDQQRRTCVLPSEVACNPYNIINSQGRGPLMEASPNGKNSFIIHARL